MVCELHFKKAFIKTKQRRIWKGRWLICRDFKMTSTANTDYHIIFISKCVASFFLPLRLYTNQILPHKEGQNISLSWLSKSGKDRQYSVELGQERQGSQEPGREKQSMGAKTSVRRARQHGKGVFPAVPIPRERGSWVKTNWSRVELTEPFFLFFPPEDT